MIASTFTYEAPSNDADLCAALRGGGTVLGGGTWVVPELSQGSRTAERIIDLRRMGFDDISASADSLRLGSMVTYASILRNTEPHVALRLLRRMASGITGGPQLRNVATVGGSAAYATPSSEVPAVLVALEATAQIMSPDGDRTVPVTGLFLDAFTTCLRVDEAIRAFTLPSLPLDTRIGYVKLKLSESSYPIATAAAHGEVDGDGALTRLRLTVGAACAVPMVVPVDDLVVGRSPAEAAPLVSERVRDVCEPYADVLTDGAYRRDVAGVVAKRRGPATRGGSMKISLTANGLVRQIDVDPRRLLVEAVREELRLPGTHVGCLTGDCGACTLELDGEVVKSCMILAVAADGREVRTIEGVADGNDLDPIQQAFWDEHGFQCGFCLPGMLFSARDLLRRDPDPDEDAIRTAINGTLCRCTGYEPIVRSIRRAAAELRQPSS